MKNHYQFLLKAVYTLFFMTALNFLTIGQTTLSVNGIGDFHLHPTQYGNFLNLGDTLSGQLFFLNDGQGNLLSGCEDISDDLQDKIVVMAYDLTDDADCLNSYTKVSNAEDAGAAAVIMVINDPNSGFPSNYGISDYRDMIPAYTVLIEDFYEVLLAQGDIETADIYYYYDDSDVVLWYEDFGNGFDSENGLWTSRGIVNDTTVWVYAEDAQSKGWIRHFLIDSPSKGNGAALLDTDGYITKGATVPPPPNYPYGDVGGELISPVIDLTDSGPVVVKWYQYCIGLNTEADSYIGLYYSTDGGENWSSRINLTTTNIFNANTTDLTNPEIQRVFLPEAGGSDNFRFKIEFRSDLYAMLVDDIQIVSAPSVNLSITDEPYYTPRNYMQPKYAIGEDEFFFEIPVQNNGSLAQENITIQVDIINQASNEIVETITGIAEQTIPVGEELYLSLKETYKPEGLDVGKYTARFTVIPEEEDSQPQDNITSFTFEVSDRTYSETSATPRTNSWYNSNNYMVAVGNVYTTPSTPHEDFFLVEDIKISYINDGGVPVDGKTSEVLITEVPETIAENWDNWDFSWSADPYNLEEIKQIAFQIVPLDGTQEGDLVSATQGGFIDANTFQPMERLILESGKRYIFWHLITDPSLALGLTADYRFVRAPAPFIYDGQDQRYYSHFTNGVQAVIIADLKPSTINTEQVPLPEGTMIVYPNPVSENTLYLDLNFETATEISIYITDSEGVLKALDTHNNITKQTVNADISDLPGGIYFVHLVTKNGSTSAKFIKH